MSGKAQPKATPTGKSGEEKTATDKPPLLSKNISEKLTVVLEELGYLPGSFVPAVVPTADPRFGDYQSNAAMVLGKELKRSPRDLAQEIAGRFSTDDLLESVQVAGPGFLNFKVCQRAWEQHCIRLWHDERLGVAFVPEPKTVVIDFSSPNIAKPMHVGHIRSTIIGDALARIARFLGHNVITDNHLGDWGTQFGKVIVGWKKCLNRQALEADPIEELVRLYRETNRAANDDSEVEEACRAELVKLQQGDEENHAIWEECVALSLKGLKRIYERLNVTFDHWLGESFYNEHLSEVVQELTEAGLVEESEGARVVWNGELSDSPFIVQKADGGFNYASTDLATVKYRIHEWEADAIWYVVGAPQKLHFDMLFATARRWGFDASLAHIAFGSILGEDRKMMKTRSGDSVLLESVLDEAVEGALDAVKARNPDWTEDEMQEVARRIGIGSLKYGELSQHRMSDYVFSLPRMIALQGNTAPYLQNAYVRIQSIFRKYGKALPVPQQVQLHDEAEMRLAVKLALFAETVPTTLDGWRPNILANYLYELATQFHSFFEACPVLKSEGLTQITRLTLCDLTAKTLKLGLDLLGIEVPDRM
ncbi:MAG: arginine--tRNA ligase [Verrucomicrobiales bacterium]